MFIVRLQRLCDGTLGLPAERPRALVLTFRRRAAPWGLQNAGQMSAQAPAQALPLVMTHWWAMDPLSLRLCGKGVGSHGSNAPNC